MSTEIIFNSITIQSDEIQEQFPDLVSVIYPHRPAPKKTKRRRRKKKLTAGPLIQEIINSIQAE